MIRRLIAWLKKHTRRTSPSLRYHGTLKTTPLELQRILGMPIIMSPHVPPGTVYLVPSFSLIREDAITVGHMGYMGMRQGYIVAHVGIEENMLHEELRLLREALTEREEEILRQNVLRAFPYGRTSTGAVRVPSRIDERG